MKKIVIPLTVLVLILGLLGGCFAQNTAVDDTPSSADTSSPTQSQADGSASDSAGSTTLVGDEPPQDMTWISPGKVIVGNFYPGATAEYPITVHNGNDYATSFSVTYRYPDNVGEGYSKPSSEVQDWVIIADMTPILQPYETRDIMVTLSMPEDAIVFAEQWEFWVSVSDTTQTGMVTTAMASRWLISMRSG